jgi:nucleotide-binding universal stress UspA family protein
MVEIKKILFPCDFTKNSEKILSYVRSMAEKYDSTIYLLHVVQDLRQWGLTYVPHASLDVDQKKVLQGADRLMDRICEEQLESCPNFQRRIVAGDPAEEIIKFIESEGIDLVIMGTHGRKGLEKALFGSVAAKVVRSSSAPVLTVNPQKLA